MTQEEKQLLLKDLAARFPYGVVLDVDTTNWKAPEGHIQVKIEGYGFIFKDMSLIVNGCYYGDNYKPYLRPMSSMTEEEKKVVCSMNMISDTELNDRLNYQRIYVQNYTIETFDYFNERKLDYRRLIEKGLALEAPEGMYKNN